MYWPARRLEAYNVAAIYRVPPDVRRAPSFEYWYPHLGDDGRFQVEDFGRSSLEGGDVQPIGNGTVLIGMSERTQARMIEQIARALFAKGAAERVIAVVMTKDRAHMHLDTVFTMLDRDKVTAYPQVMDKVRAISLRPGTTEADVPRHRGGGLPVGGGRRHGRRQAARVETGGDAYQQEREQWDDGNNVVALEPGVVVAYERNTYTIAEDARGRHRGHHDRGLRAGQGPRRRALHDLPAAPRPALEAGDARWTTPDGGCCWSSLALVLIVACWPSRAAETPRPPAGDEASATALRPR